jgi:S-disulfanyl-L-cysteine oxidoreductase SoxD
VDVKVASFLPDYAKNVHGNLAEQNRVVGGVRGVNTALAATPAAGSAQGAAPDASAKPASEFSGMRELANKSTCLACHGIDRKVVGPGFNDIAGKYKSDATAAAYLAGKIKQGGQGVWGSVPMPPATVSDAEAQKLAQWILKGTPE